MADVCCLQTEDVPSCSGYQPQITGLPSDDGDGPPGMVRPRYDYDGCSAESVLTRMRVQRGRIVLPDGMSYRLLALPPGRTMTPALLAKIKDLVEAGATVVGAPPVRSPGLTGFPACDRQVERLAAELWGDCDGSATREHRFGRGKAIWGKTAEGVLAEMGVRPDFECKSFAGAIRYIHRRWGHADVYFVANAAPRTLVAHCTFRVAGKRPAFWHPDSGQIEPAIVYRPTDQGTQLPVGLGPSGSVFVVFQPDADAPVADRVDQLARDGRPVLAAGDEGGHEGAARRISIRRAVYGVPAGSAQSRDVTASVRRLVDRGIEGIWVEYAMPGSVAPGFDEDLDGRLHDRWLPAENGENRSGADAAEPGHRAADGGPPSRRRRPVLDRGPCRRAL